MVMVNLGSTDDSRYTGYREITDRDVLDLQCIGHKWRSYKPMCCIHSSTTTLWTVLFTKAGSLVSFYNYYVSFKFLLVCVEVLWPSCHVPNHTFYLACLVL